MKTSLKIYCWVYQSKNNMKIYVDELWQKLGGLLLDHCVDSGSAVMEIQTSGLSDQRDPTGSMRYRSAESNVRSKSYRPVCLVCFGAVLAAWVIAPRRPTMEDRRWDKCWWRLCQTDVDIYDGADALRSAPQSRMFFQFTAVHSRETVAVGTMLVCVRPFIAWRNFWLTELLTQVSDT